MLGPYGNATLYQYYFPKYRDKFHSIVQDNCSDVYTLYTMEDRDLGNKYCYAVFTCILNNTDEGTKSVMAASAVLLGLMPTIMAILGNSTAETSLLSLQRPFLSLCLSLGAPVLSPNRPFESLDPSEMLKVQPGRYAIPPMHSSTGSILALCEYLVLFAACANNATLAYDIGLRTVGLFMSCNVRTGALIWTFAGAGIHLVASIAFRLRASIATQPDAESTDDMSSFGRMMASGRTFWQNELTLCTLQKPWKLHWGEETLLSIVLNLGTSICIAAHLVFGTGVFAALYLLGIQDALVIIVRYLVSTVLCRGILMFELAGIRETAKLEDQDVAKRIL